MRRLRVRSTLRYTPCRLTSTPPLPSLPLRQHSSASSMSSPFTVWPCPVLSPSSSLPSLLSPSVAILRSGGVVALPTETVYGLAGDAFNDSAIRRIFQAKGRPSDNPLIVHSHSLTAVQSFCQPLSTTQLTLAQHFWPGPLTLLLTPQPHVGLSPLVTAGQAHVAVRIPSHPIALAVLALCGFPLAAPSANTSGKPSPTCAEHVVRDLGEGRGVGGVVDSGDTGVGLESSVVQVIEEEGKTVRLRILRPGAVTREELQELLPHAEVVEAHEIEKEGVGSSASNGVIAPGMKYAHYQPQAKFVLLEGGEDWRVEVVRRQAKEGMKVGVICAGEEAQLWSALQKVVDGGSSESGWGSVSVWVTGMEVSGVAHDLFRALRGLDDEGVERIFTAVVKAEGLGVALMNRMDKAAAGRRWKEHEDTQWQPHNNLPT